MFYFLLFWITICPSEHEVSHKWKARKEAAVKTRIYSWGRRKQTLQNGICPLQVTFSQLKACSPERVPFWAAVHPNVPHCEWSFISLCVLEVFKEVHEESSYENSNIATSMGIGSFFATESVNCANRSDHQAPKNSRDSTGGNFRSVPNSCRLVCSM